MKLKGGIKYIYPIAFSRDKKTILILDYSNGFGFRDIFVSTIATNFFNFCKMSLKECIFCLCKALKNIIRCVTVIYCILQYRLSSLKRAQSVNPQIR